VENFYRSLDIFFANVENFYRRVENFYRWVENFYRWVENFYRRVESFYRWVESFYRRVENFEQIIEIGTTYSENWFRGHPLIYNELTPSVYRKEYVGNKQFNIRFEFWVAENFKRIAPSMSIKTPEVKNHLEWLFIMQHYGSPTRLLDWTENILKAVFFCVTKNPKKDAELWSMFPLTLNEFHQFWGFPLPSESIAKFLASAPFHNNQDKLKEELKLDFVPRYPLAILPPLKNERMTAQQSTFTIHPIPKKGDLITDMLKEDDKKLVRYIIPHSLKDEFEWKLLDMGITYRTLFPDLEGLSKSIKQLSRRVGWGQPNHPKYKKI